MLIQLAEMEARVVGAETRAEIAEEKVFGRLFFLISFVDFVSLVCIFHLPLPGRLI